VEVQWADRRRDVLAALDLLASEPSTLSLAGLDGDPRYRDLANAVHWLVDDTWWDHDDASKSVGTILLSDREAEAVKPVVAAVVEVSDRQGSTAPDSKWFADPKWNTVRTTARSAADLLRHGDATDG
jgi:hypothetical protein